MLRREIMLVGKIKNSVKGISSLYYSEVIKEAEKCLIEYFKKEGLDNKFYSHFCFVMRHEKEYEAKEVVLVKKIDKVVRELEFFYLEYNKNMERAIEKYNKSKKENFPLYYALKPYLA